MTRRFFVSLSNADYERLVDLADRERRGPQDQARVLLEQALAKEAEQIDRERQDKLP